MLKIDSLDYFLPNKKITNEDIFKKNKKWKSKSILDKTGVKNRYYANENETALDMSVEACKKLINNNEIDIDKIDGLIFCTQSPDHIMPPNSSILHLSLIHI